MRRNFWPALVCATFVAVAFWQAWPQSNVFPPIAAQTPWYTNENANGFGLFGLNYLDLTNLSGENIWSLSGSNATFQFITTNSLGARQTNTWSIGGTDTNLFRIPGFVVNSNQAIFFGSNTMFLSSAGTLVVTGAIEHAVAGQNTTNNPLPTIDASDPKFGGLTASDCTATIQAAIEAAVSYGQVCRVFIPAGVWHISGTLKIDQSIILEGEAPPQANGIAGTLLYKSSGAAPCIVVTTNSVAVKNLWLFGPGASTAGSIGLAIATNLPPATAVSGCLFENLTISAFRVGVAMSFTWTHKFLNCYVNGNDYGYYASNAVNAIDIDNGHINDTNGIYLFGDSNYKWDIHTTFEVCSNGILMNGANNTINVASYFENGTNAIQSLGAAVNLNINGSVFINGVNTCRTNIIISGATDAKVVNCEFLNAVPQFDIDSSVTSFFMENNYVNPGSSRNIRFAPAPVALSFPATTVNWTNPTYNPITVYINNGGVPMTALKVNGTTVFTTGSTNQTITLRPGDYFSQTYASGSPTAAYLLFP